MKSFGRLVGFGGLAAAGGQVLQYPLLILCVEVLNGFAAVNVAMITVCLVLLHFPVMLYRRGYSDNLAEEGRKVREGGHWSCIS